MVASKLEEESKKDEGLQSEQQTRLERREAELKTKGYGSSRMCLDEGLDGFSPHQRAGGRERLPRQHKLSLVGLPVPRRIGECRPITCCFLGVLDDCVYCHFNLIRHLPAAGDQGAQPYPTSCQRLRVTTFSMLPSPTN